MKPKLAILLMLCLSLVAGCVTCTNPDCEDKGFSNAVAGFFAGNEGLVKTGARALDPMTGGLASSVVGLGYLALNRSRAARRRKRVIEEANASEDSVDITEQVTSADSLKEVNRILKKAKPAKTI